MDRNQARSVCEEAYRTFHSPAFVAPDPLECVREAAPEDRETVAFLCACMAMGRVGVMLRALRGILDPLGGRDGTFAAWVDRFDPARLPENVRSFKYRFFDSQDLSALLWAMAGIRKTHGTLENLFLSPGDSVNTVISGLQAIHDRLYSGNRMSPLFMADPRGMSALKRSHLFLRWMVRQDQVDPGGWTGITPGILRIPLDTHMLRHARRLGFTARESPDRRAADEVTAAFADLCPEDPCRYDFALSRMGIHPGARTEESRIYRPEGPVQEGK